MASRSANLYGNRRTKIVNSHGIDLDPTASQTKEAEHSVMEVRDDELPCAVDVRITKRHGCVRLSLSNIKRVQKSDNQDHVSFVRSRYATHLTKEQLGTLAKLTPKLKAALGETKGRKRTSKVKEVEPSSNPKEKKYKPLQKTLLDQQKDLKRIWQTQPPVAKQQVQKTPVTTKEGMKQGWNWQLQSPTTIQETQKTPANSGKIVNQSKVIPRKFVIPVLKRSESS